MWQKCPICNGTGIVERIGLSYEPEQCPTCKGHRIINEITGLPPEHVIVRVQEININELKNLENPKQKI